MISNCGHDEYGKYTGGQAGDQTGQEWAVIPWYSRPWNVVLRYPDPIVGEEIANLAYAAAENNYVGYDQNQRTTYWTQLKAVNYNPALIKTPCEADCSAGVAANVKAVGYKMNIEALKKLSVDSYTGNLRERLMNAGFIALYDKKYLNSDKYLLPGDILLYEGHHTATNLSTGSKAKEDKTAYPCWIQVGKDWYYRVAEGKNAHGFQTINHHKYYFDSKGKMLKDWFEVDDGWYYGQPSGGLEGALYTADQNGKQSIIYVE
jgi:hypothetical protein